MLRRSQSPSAAGKASRGSTDRWRVIARGHFGMVNVPDIACQVVDVPWPKLTPDTHDVSETSEHLSSRSDGR